MTKADLSVSRPALLEGGSDKAFRRLVQDMLGVSGRMQTLRERLGELAGVTGPQYSLLAAVAHLTALDLAATVTRLADHLHVSSTYVTAESGKLVTAGLLLKTANPADRRSVCLALSAKGQETMRRLMPVLRLINDEIFRDLDHAAFVVLCREMTRMIPALDDALVLVERTQREREYV